MYIKYWKEKIVEYSMETNYIDGGINDHESLEMLLPKFYDECYQNGATLRAILSRDTLNMDDLVMAMSKLSTFTAMMCNRYGVLFPTHPETQEKLFDFFQEFALRIVDIEGKIIVRESTWHKVVG